MLTFHPPVKWNQS